MYIPLRRVVLSLPTKDETPEEFGQTVMIGGHAATGTPQWSFRGTRCRQKHNEFTRFSVILNKF